MPAAGRGAPALIAGVAILGWSLAARSAEAAREPADYWTGPVNAPVPETLRGGTVAGVADVQNLLQQRGSVAVDVSNAPRRPEGMAPGAPWLPPPHHALPGAVWIPGAGAGDIAPQIDSLYRARLRQATVGDFDMPLVIYCHEKCWLSWNAAKRAIGYGYRHVAWFAAGIEAWTAAGRATTVAAASHPKLLVLDLELTGDLGGPEFAAEHAARLKLESERLRLDLDRTGMFELVNAAPAQADIERLQGQQAYLHDCNGCDLDIGRKLHADAVMVDWVDRVSGLILSLTYEIHDVESGNIMSRQSFDFRGDNDNAWSHAVDYLVRHLPAEP